MLPEDIKDKTVIVAPLDWGMGHLTRCLPIVQMFLKENCQVVFAGTEFQCDWMKKECPLIVTEKIEGYRIRLDTEKSTYWQMLIQSAKMLASIKNESQIADSLSKKHKADFIVSDNRYGFKADSTYNIFLTHQLSPPIPKLRVAVTKKIVKWVNQFDECWIQDLKEDKLCPDLNEVELEIPKNFIGWSNRFSKIECTIEFKFCFIASGPEPQLTLFCEKIEELLEKSGYSYQLVVPGDMGFKNQNINPSTDELNAIINKSEIIISRAGYTTIMELLSLSKKSILVPTPGQFEQEYLAKNTKNPLIHFVSDQDLDQFFTSL